jgi:hypothetical protein
MENNKQVELTEEQKREQFMDRVKNNAPLAKKIFQILAANSDNLILGESNEVKDASVYDEMAVEVTSLMLAENIRFWDKDFVFTLAFQAFDELKRRVVNSADRYYDNAVDKLWGKDTLDLQFQDINNVIIKEEVKS